MGKNYAQIVIAAQPEEPKPVGLDGLTAAHLGSIVHAAGLTWGVSLLWLPVALIAEALYMAIGNASAGSVVLAAFIDQYWRRVACRRAAGFAAVDSVRRDRLGPASQRLAGPSSSASLGVWRARR